MEKNMAVVEPWRVTDPVESGLVFNFLCRSWGASALEVSKAHYGDFPAPTSAVTGNPFAFASSETSQLIMSQSEEVCSGRLSHSTSSGPLNGSLTDSPPLSPSQIIDDIKYWRVKKQSNRQYRGKTVGRWLKDKKEKNKEETRAHNAQLHAAVSVAGVAAAVAAIAAASSIDMAVASASALVAAQCVEAAESMGADRHHLASVVSSAVNVRSAADIMTLTAAAATALRGAATLKARVLVIGAASGSNASSGSFSGDIVPEDCIITTTKELLARGSQLLKRTRKGHLHWKIVSVYINPLNQVTLKMKSRHAAGTITKKKKNLVLEVVKDMPAWPGRYLLEGGEKRRYFGLKTVDRGLVEFECKTQREYEVWTEGVSKLLSLAAENTNNRHRI